MMAWITPVTNRAGTDTKYTYEDLNRVGNDVQHLADLLISYGYGVTVSTKTNFAVGEKSNNYTAMTQYLSNVIALKTAFYGTEPLPANMNTLTDEQANSIEKLLIEIEDHLTQMLAAFRYCGELIIGEDQ